MNHFTLALLPQDDTHYHLSIKDPQQNVITLTTLAQSEIDILLKYAEEQYKVGAIGLEKQGERLFDWLDQHSNGWLRGRRKTGGAMALLIDVQQAGLRHLAWELLHDGKDFLCADALHLFTPLRIAAPRPHTWQAEKRPLSLLFMASSPEDVQPVLDFEHEEALIFQATKGKAIQLQVEESGSLRGLQQRLEDRATPLDVLHLSGHATIKDNQPVFLLEDDIGNVVYVTAQQLAQTFVAADCYPRVVFLSGCRTAQSQQQQDILSFSEQMVAANTPVVLGWALPVGDQAASQTAAFLYGKLAQGADIATAVALARQQLHQSDFADWHLLRCSVAQTSLTPLVKRGYHPFHQPQIQQQFLDAGGQVPVCARTEFIGRRRLLQRSLRGLRAMYGEDHYADGLLLRGMGGLGKSSVAARLIERLSATHQPIVFYGGINETVVLQRLGEVLPAIKTLLNNGELDLAQRLAALFQHSDYHGETVLVERPLLLVFDDFEQNIPEQERKQAKAQYTPESLQILHAILRAIRQRYSQSRVIITSRFAVTAPAPCQLHLEALDSFRATDLQKKLRQLTALQNTTEHKQRAIELAAGNPRLLEWFDEVFKQSTIDADALLAELANKAAEFREAVLIEALVDAQSTAVRYSLACAALYHLPVPISVIEALTDVPETKQHLHSAAQVGLVEIISTATREQYFVSPLLDSALTLELTAEKKQQLQGKAGQALYAKTEQGRSEAMAQEIVRLAVLTKDKQLVVQAGNLLAFNMIDQNRYREAEVLCHNILNITNDFRILTTLARAEKRLGREGFTRHIEQAVAHIPQDKTTLSDELLKASAITMGVFADILQARGKLKEAFKIHQDEAFSIYDKLGDIRSKAMTMGKIADIMQAWGKFDEALKIHQKEALPVYTKLKDLRGKAMIMGRIADILQLQGKLDRALEIRRNKELPVYEKLGDIRSKAVSMGRIADIMQSQGELNEALKIHHNEELPVYEKLGDARSKAVTMENIAHIFGVQGYIDTTLSIYQNEVLPVYQQLGDVRSLLVGRANLALFLSIKDQHKFSSEVKTLLCLALHDAQRLHIPEAQTIEGFLQQMDFGL